MSYSPRWIF